MLKLSVARGPRVLQSPKPLDGVNSHERVSKGSANTLTLQCQGSDKIENLGKMQAFQQIWIRSLEHGVPSVEGEAMARTLEGLRRVKS